VSADVGSNQKLKDLTDGTCPDASEGLLFRRSGFRFRVEGVGPLSSPLAERHPGLNPSDRLAVTRAFEDVSI